MCLMEGQWIEALDHNSPSAAVIQLSFRTTEDGRTLDNLCPCRSYLRHISQKFRIASKEAVYFILTDIVESS